MAGDIYDYSRVGLLSMESDFDTDDIKRKLVQWYSTGFGEWRGCYASSGVN